MNDKDPRQILAEMAETDLMLRARASLEQFTQFYENNKARLQQQFCQPFQDLFKKGNALQATGKQGEIAFLAITVLRSFIMEHCYQLRLDLYNQDYLLDPVECSGYLNLDYLFKYIDSDIESFVTGLKDCGAKFTSYEVDRIKKDYIEVYAAIAQDYLVEFIPVILELKEFAMLKRAPDFKILYGEYHDRTVALYDALPSNERGEV